MKIEYRIQRHGRHLKSLACIGVAGVAALGDLAAASPWIDMWALRTSAWSVFGMPAHEAAALPDDARMLLSAACLLVTLAFLLPLLALRQLGQRLRDGDALGRPVADAFRSLAHSLPLMAGLRLVANALAGAAAGVGGDDYHLSVDVGDTYLFLIACLCLYSVAHLMRLAAETADDARSIV